MDYEIQMAENPLMLQRMVRDKILKGYEIVGGVSFGYSHYKWEGEPVVKPVWVQAMFLKEG